jgi:hypothetical protein
MRVHQPTDSSTIHFFAQNRTYFLQGHFQLAFAILGIESQIAESSIAIAKVCNNSGKALAK